MPVFVYEAIQEPGAVIKGEIDAEDAAVAAALLLARGCHVLSVSNADQTENKTWRLGSGLGNTVKFRDLVRYTRELASLLRAGFPLVQAIGTIRSRDHHTPWRGIWANIRARLEDGQTLSQALETHSGVFGPMYVNLVRAGEESGKLPEVLSRLANLGEKQEEIRGRVKMATVYPLVMLLVGAVTVFVMVTFVVPMFVGVFRETGQALPVPTRMLVWMSDMVSAWWPLIVPGAVACIWAGSHYMRSEQGKRVAGAIGLRAPLIRRLVKQSEVAAFSRTFGTLLSSGVPIVSALRITAATLRNAAFKEATEQMAVAVREGESLSGFLLKNGLFPSMVANIVSVGERTGDLTASLEQIADENEKDLDKEVKIVMTLLEPAMVILMGGVVGFIVMAMLLPIFSLGDVIQP